MKELEEIIEEVGGSGRYQKRLLYVVLGPLFFILPLAAVNEIFSLNVPEHWCSHAMQKELDYNETQEWKECFLPPETKPNGEMGFSSCKMYQGQGRNWRWRTWRKDLECPKYTDIGNKVVDCPHGWSFSKENFERTAVTDNEWVCENSAAVPHIYAAGTAGAFLGTLVFNYASDAFGRKFIVWITISMIVVFGLIRSFISHIFWLYLALKIIKNSAVIATFQIPFSIMAELADKRYRSWTIGVTAMLWTFGMSLLPVIAWLLRDWRLVVWVCVPLLALTFAGYPFVPESPRFLLGKKRLEEATKILSKVAKVNGNPKPKDLESRLQKISDIMASEVTHGYLSLFSKSNLAKKTMLLGVASVASHFIYYNMMINVGNMAGGLFTNFFLMSIIEAPANYLAIILADKLGRRWAHTIVLFINFLCLLFNGIFATNESFHMAVRISAILAKFISTASFVILYVQAVEIYPTSIRNTGMGFESLFASVINTAGPHVIHLGNIDARLPYLIMAGVCLVGSISASFLPETFGHSLPETIEEADKFGKEQKYFSWKSTHD